MNGLGMVGIAVRIKTKITIQCADRAIGSPIYRYRAHHRRQINIDAGRLELGTPYGSRLP